MVKYKLGNFKEIICPSLIRDMEKRVIPDVMNDVFYPKEDTLKISC